MTQEQNNLAVVHEHTPGPWEHSINPADCLKFIIGCNFRSIAHTHMNSDGYKEENEANARLIACAPELFEFAEATAQTFGADTMIGAEARKLIAKARGQA